MDNQGINSIKILWKRKVLIIVSGFLCAAAAAAASLFLPNRYMATSALVIIPRTFQTDLNVKPLNILVYKELALSPALMDQLAKEFHSEGLTSSSAAESANVRLVEQDDSSREKRFAPIMEFQFANSSPQLAQKITNRWTDIFIQVCQVLTEQESSTTLTQIKSQYDSKQTELDSLEKKITRLKQEKAPEILAAEIDARGKNHTDTLAKLLEVQLRLETNRAILAQRKAELGQMQTRDGRWRGEQSAGKDKGKDAETLAQEILRSKQLMLELSGKIDDFTSDTRIPRLREEYDAKIAQLKDLETQLVSARVNVQVMEKQVKSLDLALENQKPATVLSRAMEPDDIFQILGGQNPESLSNLGNLKIATEVLNPVYTELEKNRQTYLADLAGARTRVQELEKAVEKITSEVDKIKTKLLGDTTTLTFMGSQRDVYKAIYDAYAERYVALKKEVDLLNQQVDEDQKKLIRLQDHETTLRKEIDSLLETLLNVRLKIAQMERDQKNSETAYNTLADALTKAQMENAETAPLVKIAARAVAPSSKIGPRRSMMVALGGLIGLFVPCALILLQAMLGDSPENKNEKDIAPGNPRTPGIE